MNLRETLCQKPKCLVDMIHNCDPNPSTEEVGKDQEFKLTYTTKPVPDLNKAEKETLLEASKPQGVSELLDEFLPFVCLLIT